MVTKGQFRDDLFYRLNVITIQVPPLRDRIDDIPLLARSFVDRVNAQNYCAINSVSGAAVEVLKCYRWPGNVRELLNIIERIMVLADKAKTMITSEDVTTHIAGYQNIVKPPEGGGSAPTGTPAAQEKAVPTLSQLEQEGIQAALKRYNNNKTRAANAIGISVRTLQRKLASKEAPALVLLRTEL